jgi:hypothetical protein
MDSYQAVYDAVRSRMSNGDIGHAVESAVRDMNLSHYADMVHRCAQEAVSEWMRPSVTMRPKLYPDGSSWCVLYGENLQEGVCGFGASPDEAMRAFDAAWYTKIKQKEAS